MTGLLLGTSTLKETLAANPTISAWLEAQGDSSTHATLASIASLLASAERMPDVSKRRIWIDRLTEGIPADFGPRLHGFTLAAARQWSAARASVPAGTIFVEHDLLVIAVALAEELIYVAPREPWHDNITGLQQYDPWTSKSYPT